ncbi:MAG: SAM-dependent methyltransferase [Flavobacteriia bacterium]|nr:SAM-dependent methyltransferase [Flavobacteriia bacterium]
MNALEAKNEAQKIAFSPFVFQTAVCLIELGILEFINENKRINPVTIVDIAKKLNLSEYGVKVLVEMAVSAEILEENENKQLTLSKTGLFLLMDKMTRVNLHFTNDICYEGLYHLKEAITTGKPAGLKMLGDWQTIYIGLSKLTDKQKKSWFDFDHYYSDHSFDDALKIIFKYQPKLMYDIGGNTGKWAIAATNYNTDIQVKLLDLPGQIAIAQENIHSKGKIAERVSFFAIDMLNPESEIPAGADAYWMSQFLDCFGEHEIEMILKKIKKTMKPDADVYIMETFIDNQTFPAATFSLVATSLYFTVMANGNSKMYSLSSFLYIIDKAGFELVEQYPLIGGGYHTILHIKMKK